MTNEVEEIKSDSNDLLINKKQEKTRLHYAVEEYKEPDYIRRLVEEQPYLVHISAGEIGTP